ncbi:TPA_asm: coat protein [Date palm-associated virus A]|nr:TPA_asm: coat protein [Date palm-associated virus A]
MASTPSSAPSSASAGSNSSQPSTSKAGSTESASSQFSKIKIGEGLKIPSQEELAKFKIDLTTNKVARTDQINEISEELKAKSKLDDVTIFLIFLEVAMYCYHNGSSPQLKLEGASTVDSSILREELAGIIRRVCSLRQFCAFFAKFIWNIAHKKEIPPNNWADKGLTNETKYAAFDFFHGVLSGSSLEPPGGLIVQPRVEEIIANNTLKMVMIHRQVSKQATNALTIGEVTGGRIGPKKELGLRNPGT